MPMTLHPALIYPRTGSGNVADRRDRIQPTLRAKQLLMAYDIFQSDVGPLPPWHFLERQCNLRVMQSSFAVTVS